MIMVVVFIRKRKMIMVVVFVRKKNMMSYATNNNNSQCGSRFRQVWGDSAVGNFTPTGIPTYREVDS